MSHSFGRFVPTFSFRSQEPDAEEALKQAISRARPETDGFAEDPAEESKPCAPISAVSTVLPGVERAGALGAAASDGDFFGADLSQAKLSAHDAGVTANEVLQSALHDLQNAFQIADPELLDASQQSFASVFTAQQALILEVSALRGAILAAERSVGETHLDARGDVAQSLRRVCTASDALRFHGEKLSAKIAARTDGPNRAGPSAEAARSAMVVLVNLKHAALNPTIPATTAPTTTSRTVMVEEHPVATA